jgi:iron complex outermembrane receptor protein
LRQLQAELQLGGLMIDSGVSYTESQINKQLLLTDARDPGAGPQDVTGRSLAYAPKWTATVGPSYTVPVGFGKLTGTAQYSYTSRAYATLFEVTPIDVLGSHSLVNLNVALALNNGIRVEAYGTNLGNALYAAGTLGTDAAVWGPPRQYGVRLGYNF